ncbi:hypothetical protein HPHPP26_1515 [Helicobacter pylori Hp P-26]|nr:hypothetical protein HPHPP26_1515 [Helicobacter pylori Hp P-26]EJC56957.1 hypothetical protein HPHPP3B_0938 [Helicobacter pylori Hp P-3b]EQD93823.1 hypothetical protein L932_06265 [Helicobacter pylori PZ5026]
MILKPCSPYPLITLFKITACACKLFRILLSIPNFNSFYNFLSNH